MIKSSVQLKDCISSIMESASLKVGVKDVCDKYLKQMESGVPEELLYESFITDMSRFSSIRTIDQELNVLQYNIRKDENNIAIKKAVYEMANTPDAVIGTMIEPAVADYLVSKTDNSVKSLRESLSLFKGRPNVDKILECVELDEYQKKISGKSIVLSLKESACKEEEVLYTKEQMDDMVNAKVNEALEATKVQAQRAPKAKTMTQLEDRVQLMESIDNIMRKESRNKDLKAFCDSYKNSLYNGVSQYKLYESFISGLSQFTYLNAVDTELSAMKDRVSKYKQDIDLTKILEIMKETSSYYIVPLIEESVVDYCTNKTPVTRAVVRQALDSFQYDPFVKDIMMIISSDRSLPNMYLGESVEMNKRAHTDKVYSPVLYVKENECIFNVDGVYYDKKGNNLSRVSKGDVVKLDESFKNACGVLNSEYCSFDEVRDAFKIYSDDYKSVAYVNEGKIVVDGQEVKYNDISTLQYLEMCVYEGSRAFYDRINAVYENMNTIAMLDFVKSVHLNESNKIVDIFKLNKNIHMALINEDKSTEFYKNVNPIKCKNLMNEHMNFNIDRLFEDVMPNQKRVEEDIEETKEAYEAYLCNLKKRKEELESLKECGEDINEEDLKSAIDLIDKELDNATKDYKQYQLDIDKEFANGDKTKEYNKTKAADKKSDIKDVEAEVDTEEVSKPISETPDSVDTDGEDGQVDIPNDECPDGECEEIPEIGDITDDATEYDALFDTPKIEDNGEVGFDIVKVSFDKNIKNNKVSNKGTVIMTIPMVTANGDVKDEIKTVTFTLGDNKEPIINNDYMQENMYNAIKAAIVASPDIETVDMTSIPEEPESGDTNVDMDSSVDASVDDIMSVEPMSDDVPEVDAQSDVEDYDNPADSMNIQSDNYLDDKMPSKHTFEPLDATSDIESRIYPAKQESPAEVEDISFTRNSDEGYINVSFPIEVGVSYEELMPIMGDDFREDMKNHKIDTKPAHDDEIGDGVIITLKNRADVEYISKYLEKWLNIDRPSFFRAFPELKQFESFNYKKANILNEALILEGSIEINIDVEDDELDDLKNALDSENFKVDDTDKGIRIIANNSLEFDDICSFLSDYRGQLDADTDIAMELDKILSDISTDSTTVTLPYDANLIRALDKEGISYEDVDDDNVDIVVTNPEDAKFVMDKAEELGLDETPSLSELRDMMDEGGFVTEGLKITVEDTENHKKITFDTDDLDKKNDEASDYDKEEEESEKDSDGDASFGDDTQLYSTPDGSKKEGEDNNAGQQPKEEQQECSEPKKKKFVFKAKKLHESAKYADPHVGDKVMFKGQRGQITDKMPDGKFVVLVGGRTIKCEPSEVKCCSPKLDLVDTPHDFDKKTQKMIR